MNLICADIHFRNTDKYSLRELQFKTFGDVLKQHSKEIDYLFIAGDLFDSYNMQHWIVERVAQIFLDLHRLNNKLQIVYVLGNHEIDGRWKCPLSSFALGKDWFHIVSNEPQVFGQYTCQGFIFDSEHFCSADFTPYYVGHLRVNEWVGGDKGIGISTLQNSNYKNLFIGDFHEHKLDGKVISPGTMFTGSFKDEGYKAGYLLHDPNGYVEIQRPFIDDWPMFRNETYTRIPLNPKPWIKNNILWITVSNDLNLDELREYLYNQGVRAFKFRSAKNTTTVATKVDKASLDKLIAQCEGWSDSIKTMAQEILSSVNKD